jgi:hypothetical protein
VSCLLPATSLHGRKVTTVEGLAAGGSCIRCSGRSWPRTRCSVGSARRGSWSRGRRSIRSGGRARGREAGAGYGGGGAGGAPVPLRGVREHLCGGAAGVRGGSSAEVVTPPRHEAREKVTGAGQVHGRRASAGELEGGDPAVAARAREGAQGRLVAGAGAAGGGGGGRPDDGGDDGAVRRAGDPRARGGRRRDGGAALADRRSSTRCCRRRSGWRRRGPAGGAGGVPDDEHPQEGANAQRGAAAAEGWEGNLRGPFKLFSTQGQGAPGDQVAAAGRTRGTWSRGHTTTQTQCHTCSSRTRAWRGGPGRGVEVHLSTQAVHAVAEDIASAGG